MNKVRMRAKSKKGFTLMEVVIALAVVGLICALILPLTASAINSFNAAQSMRETAVTAASKMATKKHGESGSGKVKKKLYVTVSFDSVKIKAESMFEYSETEGSNDKYDVKVTYYDLAQVNVKGTGDAQKKN